MTLVNQLSSTDKNLYESIFGKDPVKEGLHLDANNPSNMKSYNILLIFDFKSWDESKKSEYKKKVEEFNSKSSHFLMEVEGFTDEIYYKGEFAYEAGFNFLLKRK